MPRIDQFRAGGGSNFGAVGSSKSEADSVTELTAGFVEEEEGEAGFVRASKVERAEENLVVGSPKPRVVERISSSIPRKPLRKSRN
jgi:hypothetical protein